MCQALDTFTAMLGHRQGPTLAHRGVGCFFSRAALGRSTKLTASSSTLNTQAASPRSQELSLDQVACFAPSAARSMPSLSAASTCSCLRLTSHERACHNSVMQGNGPHLSQRRQQHQLSSHALQPFVTLFLLCTPDDRLCTPSKSISPRRAGRVRREPACPYLHQSPHLPTLSSWYAWLATRCTCPTCDAGRSSGSTPRCQQSRCPSTCAQGQAAQPEARFLHVQLHAGGARRWPRAAARCGGEDRQCSPARLLGCCPGLRVNAPQNHASALPCNRAGFHRGLGRNWVSPLQRICLTSHVSCSHAVLDFVGCKPVHDCGGTRCAAQSW